MVDKNKTTRTITTARFWAETLFTFAMLIFSMAQLVLDAEERAVYFTLVSGIYGKIAKLKVYKRGGVVGGGSSNKSPDFSNSAVLTSTIQPPAPRDTEDQEEAYLFI